MMSNEPQQPRGVAGSDHADPLDAMLNEALQPGEVVSDELRQRLHALGQVDGLGGLLNEALASGDTEVRTRTLQATTPVEAPLPVVLDEALAGEPMSQVGLGRVHAAVAGALQVEMQRTDGAESDDPAVAGRIGRTRPGLLAGVGRSAVAAALLLGAMGWIAAMLSTDSAPTEAGSELATAERVEQRLVAINEAAERSDRDAQADNLDKLASDIEVTLIDYEIEGLVQSQTLQADDDWGDWGMLLVSDAELF